MDPEQLAECLPTAVVELILEIMSATVETQQAHERQAFEAGYRAGFSAGSEIGYGRAHEEMAQAWHAAHAAVQAHAKRPTHEELVKLRHAHTQTERSSDAA